jgi:hypothetical protein
MIEAANTAGGKDNISVIYVEGERFPQSAGAPDEPREKGDGVRGARRKRTIRVALVLLLMLVIGMVIARAWPYWLLSGPRALAPLVSSGPQIVVLSNESISSALLQAAPGSEVIVEPGEYHETLVLRSGVRVVSRVPRGATIRLAGTASEADAAVVASEVTGAELVGFRIVGDAATPLGTGVLVKNAEVSIIDAEVTGAADVAIDIGGMSQTSILASEVHDNPGAALAIRSAMPTRIAHNVFARNGKSERVPGSFIIEDNAQPRFSGNIFHGVSEDAFARLQEAMRSTLRRDNFFAEPADLRSTPAVPRARRGR